MDKSCLLVFKALIAGLMLVSCAQAFAVDTDGDGLDDNVDNCPAVANADQRNSDNIFPQAFASATGWTSVNGFSCASGMSTCINGQSMVFSWVSDTVSRSFAVSNPSFIQFSVKVSSWANNGNDSGSVTLKAYDASDVLLDSATWSSSAINGAVQKINLVLTNAVVFPQVTRVEVVFTGVDVGFWSGNYGPDFSAFNLTMDAGNACDDDDDGDGILDVADTFPSDPNIGTLSNKTGSVKKDTAGRAVAFAGDVNGDGYADYVVGIPGYDVPAAPLTKIIKDAGRAEVISGKTAEVLMFVNGVAANDKMSFAVAGGADVNGDGFDDVVVGAPGADNLTDPANKLIDAGSVTVLHGEAGLPARTVADSTILGTEAKALFGSALALGDVNAVAGAEIIVGSPKADDLRDTANKLVDAGSVTVLEGSTPANVYYGGTAKAYAGTSVAVSNFDAVAGADIIIGAPKDDDTEIKLTDAGSVTVYGIADATTPVMKRYGAAAQAYLGTSVAGGNIDGVAGNEVLAGAPGDDIPAMDEAKKVVDAGSVTVFFADGSVLPVTKYGAVAKSGLGNSIAAGDVNNDGMADIIAGASKDDKPGSKVIKDVGSVSVWSGNGYSQVTKLYGDVTKDYFGTAVASGDIDGDGWSDLMVGSSGYDLPAVKPAKSVKDIGSVELFSGDAL